PVHRAYRAGSVFAAPGRGSDGERGDELPAAFDGGDGPGPRHRSAAALHLAWRQLAHGQSDRDRSAALDLALGAAAAAASPVPRHAARCGAPFEERVKVLITGGGTGGHLYPALAVAEALRQKIGNEGILFIGSQRGLEAVEVPAEGYAFQALETIGFPRKPSWGSVKAAVAFFRAVLRARSIVKEFSPDVVFSTGGYASAPVVVAARLERVPIVLHEQNSIPGRTNRIASRFASEVHLA